MIMPKIVENAYKKRHFEKHNAALGEIPIYELNKKAYSSRKRIIANYDSFVFCAHLLLL